MARHWYDLRVFTRDGQGGNPLAVVPDAVGVPTDALQKGAAEIGYSETVYLDWVDESPVPKVRIFTPATELPFAGHPVVGTAWLLHRLGPTPVSQLEVGIGPVECGADGLGAWISCPVAPVEDADLVPDMEAAGLGGAGAGGAAPSPLRLAGLGNAFPMMEVSSFGDVAGARPDLARLAATPRGMAYVWCLQGERAKVRLFAPGIGIDEDPASGSAAVALASLLGAEGRLASGQTLVVHQGDEVGRPSRIEVTLTGRGTVRLSGAVSLAGTRHLAI